VSINYDWHCQRYNMWVHTMTEAFYVTAGKNIALLKLSKFQ
jgi:hypothetical protein